MRSVAALSTELTCTYRYSMYQKVTPVSLDSVSLSANDLRIAQRIQYVVAKVMTTHAGLPELEVLRVLNRQFLGMGIAPDVRRTQELAEIISQLPKSG
ncbi:MAG: hypothetical protein QOI74_1292 [Micromonosporaceae bacterium]|nr:hypothetical protein [Micromonosporaceae bacterium]MDT5035261.1 hypothetical protein [Micromonosporaceae bacterium]